LMVKPASPNALVPSEASSTHEPSNEMSSVSTNPCAAPFK